MTRLDELRLANPDVGFAVYAMEPGGPVTLELFADGNVFTFRGASEAEVLALAFPQELGAPVEEVPDVFA